MQKMIKKIIIHSIIVFDALLTAGPQFQSESLSAYEPSIPRRDIQAGNHTLGYWPRI